MKWLKKFFNKALIFTTCFYLISGDMKKKGDEIRIKMAKISSKRFSMTRYDYF